MAGDRAVSWKKAMNAGAKQKARTAEAKDSDPRRSFGGKCAMADCDSPATVRRGRHNYCRACAAELDN